MGEFSEFLSRYKITSTIDDNDIIQDLHEVKLFPKSLKSIIEIAQGKIYERGLFRIYNFKNILRRTQKGKEYFSSERSDYYCFGCDWTGRQFAVNYDNSHIFMLDHSINEFSHLKSTLEIFFCDFLVNMKNDVLLGTEFINIMDHLKIDQLVENQVLGFKVPLFLGGKDQLDNYIISDLDMDWDVSLQIKDQV